MTSHGKTLVYCLLALTIQSQSCPWGNNPVCGVDYVTYPNQCALAAAYVQKKYDGPCTKVIDESGQIVSNCQQTYTPVCGKDGVTYLNSCTMTFNKVDMAYSGPCDRQNFKAQMSQVACNCRGEIFAPICSLSGFTFENNCVLSCTQQIAQSKGPCLASCNCPQLYRPVCGVDGLTYDSQCTLNCVGVLRESLGECPSIMDGCQFCSKVFMPACGKNGVTYRNLCELKCNNAEFENFGKCEKTDPKRTTCDKCPNVTAPICGTDGRNYQNECLCRCKTNCKKYSEGSCPKQKSCAYCAGILAPVCSKKGVTYDNRCYLECGADQYLKDGACDFEMNQSLPQSYADYSALETFFKQYGNNN